MKTLARKQNKQPALQMSASLTKGHIDYVLSLAQEKKISFSQALNLIIDERLNAELMSLLSRAD